MVTEILAALAVVLIVGNVAYFGWKKIGQGKAEKVENNPFEREKANKALGNSTAGIEETAGIFNSPASHQQVETQDKSMDRFSLQMAKMQESMKAVSTKTDYIYKKVIRLEDFNEKNKGIVTPVYLKKLDEKIDSYDEFRRNTTIELQAIKDKLKELKILEEKKAPKIEDPKVKERIRNLVFNNRK